MRPNPFARFRKAIAVLVLLGGTLCTAQVVRAKQDCENGQACPEGDKCHNGWCQKTCTADGDCAGSTDNETKCSANFGICAEPSIERDPPADVDVEMKKRANISPRDMVDQAADYLEKMKDSLRHVVKLQEIARKQKDVIKLNCVNDKLLQLKQLMNIAEAANTNLAEAIARADEDGRYHEFGRITIAQQQVSVLGTEADNCIGEDLSFLGPTEVSVDAPEEPDDPTLPTDPSYPIVEPLPVASPWS